MTSEQPSSLPAAPRTAIEILCDNLSDGLHATAQPLTILRASLGNPNLPLMGVEDLRKLANSSANQVARLCTLFGFLQKFVGTESTKADLAPTPVLPILTHAIEEAKPLFEASVVTLRATVPDHFPPVVIDGDMTMEAISSLLALAQASSSPEDTVDLVAFTDASDAVQIVVRNENVEIKAPNAEMRLRIALIEANLRSQLAAFSWSLQPFDMQIKLPKAPAGSSAAE